MATLTYWPSQQWFCLESRDTRRGSRRGIQRYPKSRLNYGAARVNYSQGGRVGRCTYFLNARGSIIGYAEYDEEI